MKFSIRDLLWLTLVVATALGLGVGWWRDHRHLDGALESCKQDGMTATAASEKPKRDFAQLEDELKWHDLKIQWMHGHQGNALIDRPRLVKVRQ